MTLRPGAHLGPYEIQTALGAGGMGEVYKARDTRLGRTVAIKVLAAEVSHDPEGRLRFEREARAIAALSHPHICTLHDIGTHDGTTYLVMEHLAGETLASRLRRGPLPLGQALDIAAQIADALDAAHKHGIVHRDLKPGNVMLTAGGAGHAGDVSAKLLDFGLAKLAGHGARPALVASASVPTEVDPATAAGTLVGTLQYMAPEQLEGQEVDARTDVWALGAILYEMVTGQRAFTGDSPVSLIGTIMHAEPAALATLQPLTPPALARLVQKCLAKRPEDRWDGAHDVADELRWIGQASGAEAVARPRLRHGLWAALVAAGMLAGVVVGAGAMWVARGPVPSASVSRLSLDIGPADELNSGAVSLSAIVTPGGSRTALTWTPDGQALVFVGRQGGVQQLYVRRLDETEAHPLASTEGAQAPAVSADGQWVAFWSGGTIRKMPLGGGPAMDLVSGVLLVPRGLAWDDTGRLYFGRDDGRIWQITPDGTVGAVTTPGDAEVAHVLPWPLPGGKGLLYTVRKREWTWGDEEVVAQRFATGERTSVLRDAADARVVPTGHLVFMRRGVLFAVRFDAERLDVQGTAVAVLDNVVQALTGGNSADITGAGQFAFASTGTLALIRGPITQHPEAVLVTVDRRGQVTPLPAPPRRYGPVVRVSPDGRQFAANIRELTELGLWLYAADRGTLSLLTGGGEANLSAWAPDGRRLALVWLEGGVRSMAVQPADGTARPQVLVPGFTAPSSWTPDGRHVAAVRRGDIVVVPVDAAGGDPRPLFETPSVERWPEFSPDGRWLAYGSNVSGRDEVYIRPYPGPGRVEQVSIDGGTNPAWHPGGRELFFLGPSDEDGLRSMVSVEVDARSLLRVGRPRMLFRFDGAELRLFCTPVRCYDVAPDGRGFYASQLRRPQTPPPPVTHISLIINWFEDLKAKVPTDR